MTDLNRNQLRNPERLAAAIAAAPRRPTPKAKPASRADVAAARQADDEIPLNQARVLPTPPAPQTRTTTPRNAPTAAAGPYTGAANDLPAFTASGIDPKVLLRSPAPVRPAIAAAPTPAEAYAIAQRYAGMTDQRAAEVLATDMSVPVDIAHSWATANNVALKPSSEPEPDTFFASAAQTRIAEEKRNREYRASIRDRDGRG